MKYNRKQKKKKVTKHAIHRARQRYGKRVDKRTIANVYGMIRSGKSRVLYRSHGEREVHLVKVNKQKYYPVVSNQGVVITFLTEEMVMENMSTLQD